MRYTLEQLFNQAVLDNMATILDSTIAEARMVYGCKIVREYEGGIIFIQNTTKGGDFYKVLTDDEMEPFFEKGWRHGVYILALDNYRRKLDAIEKFIRREMNGRQNPKIITSLKSHRERILSKYNTITNKLNHEK
jgi:hypothetical protein